MLVAGEDLARAWAGGGGCGCGGARQVVAGRKKRPRAGGGRTAEGIRNQVVPRTNAQIDFIRAWGFWEGDAAGAAAVTRARDEGNGKERDTRKGTRRFGCLFRYTTREGAPKVLLRFPRFVVEF